MKTKFSVGHKSHQYKDLALILFDFSAEFLSPPFFTFDKSLSAHIFACLVIVNFLQTSHITATLSMWIFNAVRKINAIKVSKHIFYVVKTHTKWIRLKLDLMSVKLNASAILYNFITTINTNSIEIGKLLHKIYASRINWKMVKREIMAMLGFS